MRPTVYKSVDAAIDDLIEELPLLEAMKAKMEGSGYSRREPELYERICSAVELLKDRGRFRARLDKLKNPDGSVQFSFTPEAWKLSREFEERGH